VSITSAAVAKPRSKEKAGAGRSKGRCGAKVLAGWKVLRGVCRYASFTRAGWLRPWRLSRGRQRASVVDHEGEATGVSEVRFARVTTGGQRLARRLPQGNVRPTEANRTDVESGDLLGREGAQAFDAPRTGEARVLVRRT